MLAIATGTRSSLSKLKPKDFVLSVRPLTSGQNVDSNRLSGQYALITGSTSGIGLAVAKRLASRGCNVVLTGYGNVDKALSEVKASLVPEQKNQAHYIPADLTKDSEVLKLYDESCKVMKRPVNILVNNAGFQHVSPIHEFPLDIYHNMMHVMLDAPFILIKCVLPGIIGLFFFQKKKKHKWGRIINIASTHGLVASPNKSAYVAAKHGLVGMTKSIGLELCQPLFKQVNCTCNVICPGWVETELVQKQIYERMKKSNRNYEQESFALVSEKMPKGEFVQPHHVAHMVDHLCQEASDVINGTSIPIDGCWTVL
ncbi:3-hydroxybutyrate dehydrogenase family protein [Reticulomyxa filosa]|uniref:3-oxoacyl-[acyl-carrier-protein] reductase n=1 Tax=Reticulomyxa filosa TaxID=46433 RepID=X6MHN9_RETFI|nr:3-hydroxybutyrate dehydrogenase family protein [Reticulomyxa filosa]|eukprot:ETO12590.1 3-hydroxybutyrate dehydrogenase family protein [Reticulomyxa filosa]